MFTKRADGNESKGTRTTLGVHPVREALRAHKPVEKVLIAKGSAGPRIQEIIDLCRELTVPVRFEPRETLDRASKGITHQGVVAFGATQSYVELAAIVGNAKLLVILDGVEDPHNLGAIIRTAHAAGADAVVVPDRRAAPLTETVSRASAGALTYLPVVRVVNISRTIEELKQKGFWTYGIDERGSDIYDQVVYSRPSAIVLGGEGKGLHQNVQKHCDVLIRIPMAGEVSSLNVSVATGIVLFEWRKQNSSAGLAS